MPFSFQTALQYCCVLSAVQGRTKFSCKHLGMKENCKILFVFQFILIDAMQGGEMATVIYLHIYRASTVLPFLLECNPFGWCNEVCLMSLMIACTVGLIFCSSGKSTSSKTSFQDYDFLFQLSQILQLEQQNYVYYSPAA